MKSQVRSKTFRFFPVLVLVVVLAAGWLWLGNHYTVPIIMYHNIESNPAGKADTVSPEIFLRQMDFLKTHGYRVISLDNLVRGIQTGHPPGRKSVVLTFDDGYENNYTYVFPLLKRYGFPAMIFISPDFFGEDGFLSLDQILDMQKAGVQFGSHGMSQAYLPDLTDDQRYLEIWESRRILTADLNANVDYFCYPVGGFNDRIKDLVRRAGYQGALATNRGYDRFNKDVYELKRIRFSDKDKSPIVLWAKLSGYYNLFRKFKNPE
ncbi:MAG TPA: polysaccharide deacetylase family protein [Candidatus Omnitrophota bacterium]|nr:polysaccharide deacetylase family protein [Candidatus Omnitrophota bacterium]HQO58756.1 polysaccharide deacetylase family protein [Candidatus Omnitrophota bacterium]HQP11997.1 polysaccharide deacetylase family protein [Candidatus Omnitrophota bacterium]